MFRLQLFAIFIRHPYSLPPNLQKPFLPIETNNPPSPH